MKEQHTQFNIFEIPDNLFRKMEGKSYKANPNIDRSDLRYVTVLHYDFEQKPCMGELIVHKAIASAIVTIFKELYAARYPIEKMNLVDTYDADDNRSMADNNSSAFNYRCIDGTNTLSNHSMGLAIDINPLYNPYIRTKDGVLQILPEEGTPYADRSINKPYIIRAGDICYQTFIKHGFTWGGEWTHCKDYQHFEYAL